MEIKTIDLITIANAAKKLKQKDFIFYNDRLFGIDNIKNYITYTSQLGTSFYLNYKDALLINARELSAFIKALIAEESFIIDQEYSSIYTATGSVLHISKCNYMINIIENKLNSCGGYYLNNDGIDITNDINTLFMMKKTDGVFYYKINGYIITLFPGLLPLNKGDRVSMLILDNTNTFITKFCVHKKKMNVYVALAYLKV